MYDLEVLFKISVRVDVWVVVLDFYGCLGNKLVISDYCLLVNFDCNLF